MDNGLKALLILIGTIFICWFIIEWHWYKKRHGKSPLKEIKSLYKPPKW